MTSSSEPLDLAAIAAAHPVRHVRLDLAAIDVRETLTIGDIVDMAGALGVAPEAMETKLAPGGRISSGVALDIASALAFVLGRKADPELTYETVRSSWQIEVIGVGTRNPTRARAATPRSRGRRTSSPSPK